MGKARNLVDLANAYNAGQIAGYANTASTKANEAAASASTATQQAGIATTKAGEALASANAASISAGNANTSASNANTSANNANTSASSASTSAGTATSQAQLATTRAQQAADSAALAATYTPSQAGHAGDILTTDGANTSWKNTTGTGDVVLSNNPTLTGNVDANVNLRSGTLSTLLPLAGGTSELGYATDVNALVRFNGVAGEAEVLTGGGTLEWVLNDTSYAENQITPIDCTNVSVLKIIYDLVNSPTVNLENINIKLPSSEFEKTLKVIFLTAPILFGTNLPGTFTLSYNAYDIAAGTNVYFPIAADQGELIPSFFQAGNQDNKSIFETTFYPVAAQGWTRTSRQGEAYAIVNLTTSFDSGFTDSILGAYRYENSTNGTAPTSNTTVNLGSAINLPIGVWLISGKIKFASTSSIFNLTDFTAELFSATNSGNITVTNLGAISQRVVNSAVPNGRVLAFSFPSIVIQNTGEVSTTIPYYNRVNMTYASGSAIPTIEYTAVRIA